jgi:hypothetical protein
LENRVGNLVCAGIAFDIQARIVGRGHLVQTDQVVARANANG